ncbi:BEM_collapsed_G0045340.mRNA.1.CDS.1 [Saccharomyces cerevisiae]|nr:BEM_collapsed_G0045340.mRNA.1.CDS.1 [Saccharomyces cerevisiae]
MKNLSFLINRRRENTSDSNVYPGKAKSHEPSWIEMDDQTKKDGLDIVHVEFSPDTRAPSDNNKVIIGIFDATEDARRQTKFGSQNDKTREWEISASWQIGLTLCYVAGEIVGLQPTGPSVDLVGNRYIDYCIVFF